ncbi:SdpI family protein, partial [Salmonella enterica]|uniref:SdpI family protein n=1 Tax=Salmonella enterica TaxID=28901 RepID=UPI000AD2E3A0
MILFPSSLILLLLGNLFVQLPPQKMNNYFGFRTKKSMKNDNNWKKAQIEFGLKSRKIFMYTSIFSIT